MQEPSPALSRRTFVGGVTALAAASLAFPQAAFAVTAAEKQAEADAVRNQLVGLNADLEAAAERYYGALDEQNAARTAMEAEQVKIDEATAQIANLQDHLGTRARSMYRSGSATFLDFLMGATSFAEFTQNWDILNGLNENDTQMVAETKTLRETVEASKAEYAKQEKIAADKAAEAKAIKEEVEAKIAQADALMNSLDAEARALLEEEQRAAAEAAAAQKQAEMEAEAAREAANSGNAGGGGDGGTGGGNPPSGGGGNGVDIPSQGSVVDYAMSRIGCPLRMGGGRPELVRLLRLGDMGVSPDRHVRSASERIAVQRRTSTRSRLRSPPRRRALALRPRGHRRQLRRHPLRPCARPGPARARHRPALLVEVHLRPALLVPPTGKRPDACQRPGPFLWAKRCRECYNSCRASVAQGTEHRSPKAGAARSNRAGGTIDFSRRRLERRRFRYSGRQRALAFGSTTVTHVPRGSLASMATTPPACSTRARAMDSPRPLPGVVRAVSAR